MTANTLRVSIAAALGGLMFGFDVGIIGGAVPFIEAHFDLDALQLGWGASSLLLGAIVGAAFAGRQADRLGRRRALRQIALLFAVTSLATGLAFNFASFVLFRFLGGISVGAVSVISPMYLSETAPTRQRGSLISLYQLAITLGIVLSYLITYLVHDTGAWNWRWMFLAGVVPSVVFWQALARIPESPRWLLMQGREADAIAVLDRVFGGLEARAEELRLRESLSRTTLRPLDWQRPSERRTVLIGLSLAVLVQFSGVNTVVDYAPRILQTAGWAIDRALFSTFGIGLCFVAFTLLGVALIDRLGRRTLYLIGSLGMSLTLVWMMYLQYTGQFRGVGVLVLLLAYVAFFAACIGTAFWTLVAEIFPNAIRGQAMSLTSLTNWLANFLVVFFFPWLLARAGGAATFGFLALMSLVQLGVAWGFLTETKGRTLEEIQVGGH